MNLYLGIALLIALATAGFGWNNYLDEREAFRSFKNTQKALAKAQRKQNDLEKAKHDDAIKTALRDRDVALAKLRDFKPSPELLSGIPQTPRDPDKVCFSRSGLDTALRTFTGGLDSIVREGQQAVIDDRAWSEAWPR